MNSNLDNTNYKVTDHNSKAFFANDDKFYVTQDWFIKSQSGNIGGWSITEKTLVTDKIQIKIRVVFKLKILLIKLLVGK